MTRATCGVLVLLATVCLAAQQPAGSFSVERPIVVNGAGPQRLAIDVPLLARSQRMSLQSPGPMHGRAVGGLSDLRIVDAQGREVPYLLVYPSVSAHAIPHEPLTAEVSVQRRPSEPELSRYRLRLPAAGLPIVAVTLDVGPGYVFRRATVSEARLEGSQAAPVELGRRTLSRVERDGVSISGLRIPIQRPRESELELVVDDGSNPPLDLKGVSIELAELPWIYVEAPEGPLTARYGDASAAPPAYDLEAVRSRLKLADIPEARWGEPLETTAPAAEPPPFVPKTGAPIAQKGFRYRRAVPAGPGGLTVLPLDAAALAHSRGPADSFADVRIVDQAGRQVPYVLERREEPLSVPLTLRPASSQVEGLPSESGHHRSVYSVTLPYPRLPTPRLVLETSDRVFQRPVQVVVERPADRDHRDKWFDVRAATVWHHNAPDVAAHAAMLHLVVQDETELLLVVDEGDNRPLVITRAHLLLPSWRVRFFSPPSLSFGGLSLLYGHDALSPPRYDLALLAAQVMGAEAREIEAVPEDSTTESTADSAPTLVTPRMFWIGLSAAVLVLLVVIGKLVAGSSANPSRPSPPAP